MSVDCLLVGPSGHGGEEVYMRTLAANPPPGIEYRLAGSFHQGAPGAPCQRAAEVALNRIVRPLAVPDMGMRALRLRDRFDLIHVHAHPIRLSGLGDTPLVMSEGSSSAVYVGEYLGWGEERMRRAYRRSRRIYRALGINDRLLALERVSVAYVFSKWAREVNVRWGADPDKLEVIYPGFPVPSHVEREPTETFDFLFVGRDFERKGGFDVADAFDRVAGERDDVRLLLVGSDPWEPNPDYRARSWVGEVRRNRLLGRLEELERRGLLERWAHPDRRSLMGELYPRADAFVMPSLAEGFGFTNVEAMSMGLPVISSTVGPMAEVVDEDVTGILVTPGDVDALTAAMLQLAADRDRAESMGAAGRAAFQERFTVDRFRADLAQLYRRALER